MRKDSTAALPFKCQHFVFDLNLAYSFKFSRLINKKICCQDSLFVFFLSQLMAAFTTKCYDKSKSLNGALPNKYNPLLTY